MRSRAAHGFRTWWGVINAPGLDRTLMREEACQRSCFRLYRGLYIPLVETLLRAMRSALKLADIINAHDLCLTTSHRASAPHDLRESQSTILRCDRNFVYLRSSARFIINIEFWPERLPIIRVCPLRVYIFPGDDNRFLYLRNYARGCE